MGFNSAFKGLITSFIMSICPSVNSSVFLSVSLSLPPSVRTSVYIRAFPTWRISAKFDPGCCYVNLLRNWKFWSKCDESIWHFAWWPQWVLLLPAHKIHLQSIVMQHAILLHIWQWLYVNNAHGTHCCPSVATMVRRMRYNITLHVFCLSC